MRAVSVRTDEGPAIGSHVLHPGEMILHIQHTHTRHWSHLPNWSLSDLNIGRQQIQSRLFSLGVAAGAPDLPHTIVARICSVPEAPPL